MNIIRRCMGFGLILLGAGAADSPSIVPTMTLMFIGAVLLLPEIIKG